MRLDNKITAIVTGGASGLGEATVRLLRERGVNVVIADLNVESGEKIAKELGCLFFKTNIIDEENVKELFEFTKKHYSGVHIVVNSAGVLSAGMTLWSKGVLSSEEMLKVLKINVVGTFNVSKYAALHMSKQEALSEGERGVIINVASVAGEEGQKGQVVYAASKGAVIGMTLPMARDLGKFGIRVMTIAPGIFMTPMGDHVPPKVADGLKSNTPLGRMGRPIEFAQVALSICENSFATGTVWRVDGGIRLPYN